MRVLHEKFKSSKQAAPLRSSHDCHLSFTIVGAPLYIDNEYEGMLFVEGFARQPPGAREAEVLKAQIRELTTAPPIWIAPWRACR